MEGFLLGVLHGCSATRRWFLGGAGCAPLQVPQAEDIGRGAAGAALPLGSVTHIIAVVVLHLFNSKYGLLQIQSLFFLFFYEQHTARRDMPRVAELFSRFFPQIKFVFVVLRFWGVFYPSFRVPVEPNQYRQFLSLQEIQISVFAYAATGERTTILIQLFHCFSKYVGTTTPTATQKQE